MQDKIRPGKRVRAWHRKAVSLGESLSTRAFARALAKLVVSDHEDSAMAKLGTTAALAKSTALAWCNKKRVRVLYRG
jgi:hypothetical protein